MNAIKDMYNSGIGDIYRELSQNHLLDKSNRTSAAIFDFIETHIGSKVPYVVDLGCGSGEHTQKLLTYAHRATGIDISDKQISAARRLYSDTRLIFLVWDILNLHDLVGNARYDLVTAFLSLHYLSYGALCMFFKILSKKMSSWAWLVASINNPRHPEWWAPALWARSYFSSAEQSFIGTDNSVLVDLYDAAGEKVTTLAGIFHHDEASRIHALTSAAFKNIQFFGECDSLIVLSAQKS